MSNVNVDENSLNQADDLLSSLAGSLSNLSGGIASIDLSGIELDMDLRNTVSLINNVISSNYSDSSITVLRQNIENTRNALLKMNNDISVLFDKIDDYPLDDFGNFTDYVNSIKTKENSVDLGTYLDTLKSQGFTVEKIPGGYKVKTGYHCNFYLSEDCTYSDVRVISYYPGQGDGGAVWADSAAFCYQLEHNGVPSGTIAMVSALPFDDEYQGVKGGSFDVLERMEREANIDVTSVVSMGFSASGFKSLKRLNSYLKTHPNINGEDCAVLCIDGLYDRTMEWVEADELARRNVPVYYVRPTSYEEAKNGDPTRYHLGHDNIKKLSEQGVNVYLLLDNNLLGGHLEINQKMLTSGFIDYISGRTSSYSNASDYSVIRYNNNIQDFVNVYNFFEQDFSIGKRLVVNTDSGNSRKTIDYLSDKYISQLNEFYKQFSTIPNGKIVNLYGTMGKTTIDELFATIRNEYCARDATLMVAMTQAYLSMQAGGRGKYAQDGTKADNKGNRIPVNNYYTLGPGGTNCCGGVSWALFGENDPYWYPVEMFADFGASVDINSAKPGDIFVAAHNDVVGGTYHVGLILYNDPVTKEMITWEARGENYGIGIFKRTYRELQDADYVFRNPDEYYNSIDAKNSVVRDRTGLTMINGDGSKVITTDVDSKDKTTTDTENKDTDTGNEDTTTKTTTDNGGNNKESGADYYYRGSPLSEPHTTPTTPKNPTDNKPTINEPAVEQIVSEQKNPQHDSKPVIEVEKSEIVEDKNEPIVEEEPIIEDEISIENDNIPSNNDDGIIVSEPSKSGDAKKFILPGILGAGLVALAAKLGKMFSKKRKDNDEL